jgi:flagellar biosynthetic protein FliR
VLIFIAIGGDAWVIEGMAKTYELVPLDGTPAMGRMMDGVDTAFAGIFGAAIQVAGPIVLALILTDAAFGVVSRVVPSSTSSRSASRPRSSSASCSWA